MVKSIIIFPINKKLLSIAFFFLILEEIYFILYCIFNRPINFKWETSYKIKLFLLFFSLPLLSHTQQDTAKVLTIDEAVYTALNNNPYVKNAELMVKKMQVQRQSILNLGATEFFYQKGQINSTLSEHYWEVNQNLGSLLVHIQKASHVKQETNLSISEYEITKKQFTLEVKAAYCTWIYQYNKLDIMTEQYNLYSDFLRIANLHFEMGESDILEKIIAITKFANIKNQLITAEDDLAIAENKLFQLMATDEPIVPPSTNLPIYEIPSSKDTSAGRFSNITLITYYKNNYTLKNANIGLEKSAYFPEIKIGYFNQDIAPLKGLSGWSIGISLPIWFFPQRERVQQAKIGKLMALNEFEYQKFNTQKDIEILLIKLDKYFNQLTYYNVNALKQANILIATVTSKFEKEDIEYTEYIQGITAALEIKLGYLETLNSYNQTAIQLEFYIN